MYISYEYGYGNKHHLKDGLITYPFDFRGMYTSNYSFGTRITCEETMLVFEQINSQFPGIKINSIYTDRLSSWEGDYLSAIKKAIGEDYGVAAFGNMSMEEIEVFLTEYTKKECNMLAIIPFVDGRGCPLWLLIYNEK